jgi:hypothetical protein
MPRYSLAEIDVKLDALDAAIAKAEKEQAYTAGGPGAGTHTQRGDLAAMYRERQFWLKERDRIEALARGGAVNRVVFVRER